METSDEKPLKEKGPQSGIEFSDSKTLGLGKSLKQRDATSATGGPTPLQPQDPTRAVRPLPSPKLYQDELYGSEELSPMAVVLIDTPEFQRLGDIFQLGFTYKAYRGANHRRFDHCVGTYLMCKTILRRIVQNHARLQKLASTIGHSPTDFHHPGGLISPKFFVDAAGVLPSGQHRYGSMGRWRGLTEVVSAAALLHDLGHVPFGHTLEDEFNLIEKHDSLGGERLFEMLYGPRELKGGVPADAPTMVERYFSAIDEARLPRPHTLDQRVPLPWVFERDIYDPFIPTVPHPDKSTVTGFPNWECRDLIYLILSFKESIPTESNEKHKPFDQVLREQLEKAQIGTPVRARLEFIQSLLRKFESAQQLQPDHEQLPAFHPFMSDVVGNTICADLLDYLVRDGKRLKLDIRDNARLQRYLVIRPESTFVGSTIKKPRLRLTIHAVNRGGMPRRDTVSDLLDLMRERFRFSEAVYYHPKKAVFSAMLAKAIELLDPDLRPKQGSVYPAPWTSNAPPLEPPNLAHVGDEEMLQYLRRSTPQLAVSKTRGLARSIAYRDEYRLVFTLDYDAAAAEGEPRKIAEHLRHDRDEGRKSVERQLDSLLRRSGIQPEVLDDLPPVLIYCPSIKMQAKEVAAHVELKSGDVRPLNRQVNDPTIMSEVDLLNRKYRRLWRLYLFIAPRIIRLLTGDPLKETRELTLSTLIDQVCFPYSIPAAAMTRGARYSFMAFDSRLSRYFDHWHPPRDWTAKRDLIFSKAQSPLIWSTVLAPGQFFPIAKSEYELGFCMSALSLAATTLQPEESSRVIKNPIVHDLFRDNRLHHVHDVPEVETVRGKIIEGFTELGKDLAKDFALGTKRQMPDISWQALQKRVQTLLGGL